MINQELRQQLDNLKKEILSKIPTNLVLYDETTFDDDEWSEDDEKREIFNDLPLIVLHVTEDYEKPAYGRVININDDVVKSYNEYDGIFESQHISRLSSDELAYILAYVK